MVSIQNSEELVRQTVAHIDDARFQQILKALIGISSISGNEAAVAHWVYEYLLALGVEEVQKDPFHNVVANLGHGLHRLLLITYLDTMKPDQTMNSPFEPRIIETERGLAMAGLGAATSKSSCASMLIALTAMISHFGPHPPFPITFAAFSRDLHPTEHGIADLFETHKLQADGAIIGEPTRLRAGIGARGYAHLRFRFTGSARHAGRPDSLLNPVVGITNFINTTSKQPLLVDAELGAATLTPIEWDTQRQPPQTPKHAEVLMDRRLVPEDPPLDAVVDNLRTIALEGAPHLQVATHILRHQFPWQTPTEEPIMRAVRKSMQIVTGRDLVEYPLPFASAAGHIQNVAGISPVAFAGGDINTIGPAEHIVIEDGIVAAKIFAGAAILFHTIKETKESKRSTWPL